MRGYKNVQLLQNNYFFDAFEKNVVPVAIELRPSAENLIEFEHPKEALYTLGPEDGKIGRMHLQHC